MVLLLRGDWRHRVTDGGRDANLGLADGPVDVTETDPPFGHGVCHGVFPLHEISLPGYGSSSNVALPVTGLVEALGAPGIQVIQRVERGRQV